MYWIHGGCFVEGASDEYSGNDLASHGVIVVTINYRLGVFGFLGAEELRSRDTATGSTGNYGVMDAIHGLKWVRENIASFGGNPENVTIFGESAGSSLVASLLSAPTDYTTDSEGDDLFHAAILESGGFVKWSSFPMATAQNQYEGIMEKLGCTTDYYDEEVVMDCLINSSQEEVEAAFEENTEPMPCNVGCQAAPVVDGTFLPRMLSDMQSSAQVRQVPIMYGWNRHDGGVELGDQITPSEDGMTSAEYDEFWTRYTGGSTDERDQAGFGLDNYGQYGDNTAAYMATLDVITTSVYSCGVYSMIESETKDYPSVYAYEFDDSNVGEKGPESLVDHGDELSYILQEKTSDDAFYAQMRTLWTNFAKNHDPNGRVTGGAW
jgi:para-nitrobenzyl esterase